MQIFIEIALIVCIATIVSSIMRLFRQPMIVGYILSGVILGPYCFNLISSTNDIEAFSKIGIAILLFIIGLSLKPDIIREVGKVSLITGVGQIIGGAIVGFFVMRILHFSVIASVYGALALTFSSTIIVFKLLSDKGDLDRLYGKISIGVLLVQDLFAAIILLFVSIIGSSKLASGNIFIFSFFLFVKGILFFVLLYLVSKYILPRLFNFFASSQELLFIFSIAWGLGLASLFYILGFSIEIGALAAGVALASSAFAEEISSRMKPLRDFFILLFFVLLGSQIILADFGHVIIPALIISMFVLIGKPVTVIVLMNMLGFKSRTGFLTGLTMSQISEFSLILLTLAFSFGHVTRDVVSLITLVGIITITGSTYLMLYPDRIYKQIHKIIKIIEFRKTNYRKSEEEIESKDMIIFGYDRIGYDFVNIAQKLNLSYFVVDFNPSSIERLQKFSIPYRFGDAEDIDFLRDIGFFQTQTIVSTIPDFKTNLYLVRCYRNHNKNGIIIVISNTIKNTQELYKSGASFVVMSHYLGAHYASKMIERHGTETTAYEHEKMQHLEYLERRQRLTGEV